MRGEGVSLVFVCEDIVPACEFRSDQPSLYASSYRSQEILLVSEVSEELSNIRHGAFRFSTGVCLLPKDFNANDRANDRQRRDGEVKEGLINFNREEG